MAESERKVENTTISLLSASQVLWALGAVVFFVALVYARGVSTQERVDRHAEAIKAMQQNLIEIKVDIAEIKGMLRGVAEK